MSGVSSTNQCLLLPPGHRSPNQRAFKTLLWEGMPADRSQVLHLTGRQSINGPGPRASPQPITDPCLLRAQAFLWEWVPHCQTQTEPTVVLLAFPTVLPHPGLRSPQGDSVNQKGSMLSPTQHATVHAVGTLRTQSTMLNPSYLTLRHCCHLLFMAEDARARRIIRVTKKARVDTVLPTPQRQKGDACSTSGHGQLHSQISRQ